MTVRASRDCPTNAAGEAAILQAEHHRPGLRREASETPIPGIYFPNLPVIESMISRIHVREL